MKKYNWELGHFNMTLGDKFKISKFLFTNDKWTAGPEIEKYEKRWSEYTGCRYVTMVHSGSAANELIALYRKYELENKGEWELGKNKVLFNVINWISSISVWVNFGFKPEFVDVSDNLNPSYNQIKEALDKDPEIKTVFYTTLLGFAGDLEAIKNLCENKGVRFLLDNCESSFSYETFRKEYPTEEYDIHFCNITLSSTSVFASHLTSGFQEGGLIFSQDEETYNWMKMMRNHGMTRGMPDKYRNFNADKNFDFALMGSNYRSTNLIAYMHSLDFDRALEWNDQRKIISEIFHSNLVLCENYSIKTPFGNPHHLFTTNKGYLPFALPIIKHFDNPDKTLINRVKGYLSAVGVGYRGIVGGCMCKHTAFNGLCDVNNFSIAKYIDENGIYIALHKGVTPKMAESLAKNLSKL